MVNLQKILITGGAGNLGSWLTRHLIKSGFDVTVISRSPSHDHLPEAVKIIQLDITDVGACKSVLSSLSFDGIIHLASSNEFFEEDYGHKALMVNTHGTRNLLDAINKESIKHFMYFSTFHVYGRKSGLIRESLYPEPKNDYALTHYFAEKYIHQFHESYNFPYTIFRLTNSYGSPISLDTTKWYLLLNDIAKMAFEQKKIRLNSNGNAMRDFIWMGNVCEIVESALKLIPQNATFNLGAGKTLTVFEVAEKVSEAYADFTGTRIPVEINQEDINEYPAMNVSVEKLQGWVNYRAEEKFYEEAIKIFKLLEQN